MNEIKCPDCDKVMDWSFINQCDCGCVYIVSNFKATKLDKDDSLYPDEWKVIK